MADESDEIELTGEEAVRAWRQVRGIFFGVLIGYPVVLGAVWLIWHPSEDRLTWIAAGQGAVALAVVIGRHGFAGIEYETTRAGGTKEATFSARRSFVPAGCAVPVLLVAAVLLFLASTTTGVGRWLASIFNVEETVRHAGANVIGVIALPLFAFVLLIFVGIGVVALLMGLYGLVIYVARGFKPDEEYGTGLSTLLMGVLVLGFVALVVVGLWAGRVQIIDDMLGPFRVIASWF